MKCYKIAWIFGLIFLGCFLVVINRQNTRIKIASIFAVPDQGFIDKNHIPTIKVTFSNKVQLHFKDLYKDYVGEGLGSENVIFHEHYNLHNSWKKAVLHYNSKDYEVAIKSFGRTPYAHKFGEHFSLKIKFNDESPFSTKKIRLIIYNRIQMTSAFTELLSNKFELPVADYSLVLGQINSHNDYLYFIEEQVNDQFFETRGLPWVLFNKDVDGSLVFNGEESVSDLQANITQTVSTTKSLSKKMQNQIINQYMKLNNAIRNKDTTALLPLINIDNICTVNAYRIVNGDQGHGFNPNNFQLAYDTINNQFNLMVHRDCYGTTLTDCKNPFPFIDSEIWVNPFLRVINSSNNIKSKSNKCVQEFILTHNDSLEHEVKSIQDYYYDSHVLKFSSNNNLYDGNWINENVRCLKNTVNSSN